MKDIFYELSPVHNLTERFQNLINHGVHIVATIVNLNEIKNGIQDWYVPTLPNCCQ